MASLERLTAKEVVLKDIETAAGPVSVRYSPTGWNARVEREVQAAIDHNMPAAMMIPSFLGLVREWDLKEKDADKEPIPLTTKALDPVPTEILGQIIEAINKDMSPDPKTESS
jgi:hypothetical protein